MHSSLRFPRYNIANENRYGEYSQDFTTSPRRKRLYVDRKAPDVRAFARKVRGNRKDVAERLKKDRIRSLPLVLPHESRNRESIRSRAKRLLLVPRQCDMD